MARKSDYLDITITVEVRPPEFLSPKEIDDMLTAARKDYNQEGHTWSFPRQQVHWVSREGKRGKKAKVTIRWEYIQ